MLHALVTGDTIADTRWLDFDPDRGTVWWDETRWYDFRGNEALATSLGWLPLVTDPRPADTATTTWERAAPALVEGVPTVTWVERDKTADELAADQANANAQTLTADAAADLPRLEQALADTLTLLGPNDQPGSIRHHRTTVLTNQYQVAAQRAQDDLILALAVIVRRLVRQQIRDTRLQTGTLDSADVGPDAT